MDGTIKAMRSRIPRTPYKIINIYFQTEVLERMNISYLVGNKWCFVDYLCDCSLVGEDILESIVGVGVRNVEDSSTLK